MDVLVAVETVLLVLLVLLVAGLLRSHAEILRRLGPADEARTPPPASAPSRAPRDGTPAPALAGATPAGDVVKLAFDGGAAGPTLLAFLTSGCGTCAGFWEGLGDERLGFGVQPVIVTHGRDRESPSRLRSLSPPNIPVVMSTQAWQDYGVPGSPYFVLVDGEIRGEGVATTWPALASLVADAIADELEDRSAAARTGSSSTTTGISRRIDQTFAAVGIGPDHPSLYPAGKGEPSPDDPR